MVFAAIDIVISIDNSNFILIVNIDNNNNDNKSNNHTGNANKFTQLESHIIELALSLVALGRFCAAPRGVGRPLASPSALSTPSKKGKDGFRRLL